MAASEGVLTRSPLEVAQSAPGRFALRGDLTFRTARRAYEAGLRAFAAGDARDLEVDCSCVGAADSAGLAVLLGWLAWARRGAVRMRFAGLPEPIRAVAHISEVDALIEEGVAAAAG